MADSKFLETYPLYKKFKMTIPLMLHQIDKPAIKMPCSTCGTEQTFLMVNEYYEETRNAHSKTEGQVVRAKYLCMSCQRTFRYFLIKLDVAKKYIMKVGQDPAWEITPDKNLISMLGSHPENYKKGLICESQGYGIGAFAYYRRIVEEIIDGLLDDIVDLLPDEGRDRYLMALEKTKNTIVTQEKIDLVKNLLPPILRPSGMNPLSTLHSVLSEGLHAQSDDDCLEIAMTVREVLTFLVTQIATTKNSSSNFTASMQRLLEKKAK